MLRNILLISTCLFFSLTILSQEICDNGIDDDGDGLIDLNDEEDCICSTLLPSSLIPNPSFEDRTCCPDGNAQLDCAIGWIQASGPTTDYINTCGDYLGNPNADATAPLPLPDGTGAVGFRDGEGGPGQQFKEYVGACLTETMLAGVEYKLEFFVGFQDNKPGSMDLDIAIYASPFCTELPFGNGAFNDGCPTKWPTYVELGGQSISGSNEWKSIQFTFTPTQDYNVMVIGPSCTPNPDFTLAPYFYIDGLTLAESNLFGIPLEEVEGSICNDDLVLSIENEDAIGFQWYKDGIALPGETNPELNLITTPNVAGTYQVVVYLPDDCISSKSYDVRVPPYYADYETTICEGEEFFIENTAWNETGIFETTIAAEDGCDSIITLTLNVQPTTYSTIDTFFCEGETYYILDIETSQPGTYESIIQNVAGCDSVVNLELVEIPQTEGITLEEQIEIELGDIVTINPLDSDPLLINFEWRDDNQNVLGTDLTLMNVQPIETTVYTIIASDQYGCPQENQIEVRVDKSNTTIYTPNIFTPNNDNLNDFFNYTPSKSVAGVARFLIFDRWGNKVFDQTNIGDLSTFKGWDGTFNDQNVENGVYVWMADVSFIDGSTKIISGDVTLLR